MFTLDPAVQTSNIYPKSYCCSLVQKLPKGTVSLISSDPPCKDVNCHLCMEGHLNLRLQNLRRGVSFYETIEASSKLSIRFLSNLCKNDLNTVLGRNLFCIANDCSVNPSDLSKMSVKKQMKYLDVPLEHE